MQAVSVLARTSSSLLLASRASACRLSSRTMTAISGPPRVRVSTAEKMVHGMIIVGGCCFIPAWVLVNIKNYRGAGDQ